MSIFSSELQNMVVNDIISDNITLLFKQIVDGITDLDNTLNIKGANELNLL